MKKLYALINKILTPIPYIELTEEEDRDINKALSESIRR